MTGQLSLTFVTVALTAYLISTVAFALDLTRKIPVAARTRELASVGAAAGARAATGAGAGAGAAAGESPEAGAAPRAAGAGGRAGSGAGVVVVDRRRAGGIGLATFAAATLLLLAGVVTRGVAAGRAPWANMYEFTLVSVLIASIVFLSIQRKRDVRYLGTFIAGFAVLFLWLAVTTLYVSAGPVQPALQNYWLVIHVSIATSAVGLSAVGAAASGLQLLKDRYVARGTTPKAGWFARLVAALPTPDSLERLAYRVNAVGFVMWTLTLVSGAIWAEHAWGRFWGWDSKEVWTFVTWVIYAAYLHARSTRGWEGRRAAWFSLAGFASIIINFWIVNQFADSLHSYSGL